jgi:hypothetical protein
MAEAERAEARARLGRLVGGALIGVAAFVGAAAADTISFPLTLDPTIPNAWVVATYIHQCGGCVADQSDEETYLGGLPVAAAGYFYVVTGGGGAFSALDNGALGVNAYGYADGAGTGSHSYMIVNVPFSGSGMVTVHFEVDGSESVGRSDVASTGNVFQASVTYQMLDASTHAVLGTGGASFSGCDPLSWCNQTLLSFPIDLSTSFSIEQPSLVQLYFALFAGSNGFAHVAAQTGLIAIDLAPGVTMDSSSGFLSTPGDPGLAPEPSSASLSLASVAALAVGAARARRVRSGRYPATPLAAGASTNSSFMR